MVQNTYYSNQPVFTGRSDARTQTDNLPDYKNMTTREVLEDQFARMDRQNQINNTSAIQNNPSVSKENMWDKALRHGEYNNYHLGTLSGLYESKHKPDAIGTDNAGGPSYGQYQIATTPGTMQKYLTYLQQNNQYRHYANTLNEAGGNNAARQKLPSFVDVWKQLSKDNTFNESQYNFIINTHLNPLINKIQEKNILNLEKRHPVVKDALYSMSVQHQGAPKIINKTLQMLKNQYGNNGENIDDATILRALYNNRSQYVLSLPESQYTGDGKITKQEKLNIVNKRYPAELQDALNYLK